MTEPAAAKEEKVIVKSPTSMASKQTKKDDGEKKDDKKDKKKNDKLKSDKDYEIVTSKVDEDDSSKYVVPLKLPKEAPKEKKEEQPEKVEKKKLISEADEKAKVDYKIETTSFDDADVADHVKSPDTRKDIKEKQEREEAMKPREYKKAEEPIKNVKDLHEELIKDIRKGDSSLRIEVSKLNDEAIDEEIENHKETLKIAEQKRASSEAMAARIKAEDEAEWKASKAAMAEKEKKAKYNQDFTIVSTKLEENQESAQKEVKVSKKSEEKKVQSKPAAPVPEKKDTKKDDK